jgi:DNA invertase Pin-like site-specific DNA recombinase
MSRRSSAAAAIERRAAIYVRISNDDEGDELGVRRQEKLCRELAGRLGWTVVDVFGDNDVSAYKRNKRRPGFAALCDAIRSGHVDAVAVYNPDRLSRDDLRGLEDLIDLLNGYGVVVETVRSGEFDLTTAHGRAQARTAGVWARLESEKMSERLRDKMAELVAAGKPTGNVPYGYRRIGEKRTGADSREIVVVPEQAQVVRDVVERIARGETLTRVVESLNDRGVPTARNGRWQISNVRRMCLNPAYIGRVVHHGVDAGPASWEPIVDESTWRRAVALLKDPARARRRSARRYLLTGGLIVCGSCGAPLYSKQQHGRKGMVPVYACRPKTQGGCGGVTVRAEPVEQLVAEAVIVRVESSAFARSIRAQRGGDRRAQADAAKIERELEEAAEARGAGAITMAEYLRMREGIVRRLVEAQTRMTTDTTTAAVGRFAGQRGALRALWDDPATTLDRKQSIVRSVIRRVVVAPVGRGAGNRFDETRVKIDPLV